MTRAAQPRARPSLARRMIEWNNRASLALDRWLTPASMRVHGWRDFTRRVVPDHLRPGMRVYDAGGGSYPSIEAPYRAGMNLHIIGTDFDRQELAAAPPGGFSETIRADLEKDRGQGDGDLVICRSVLEHVHDPEAAWHGLASFVRPGGHVLVFVPCRNALFARLNLMLPEALKRRILFAIKPEAEAHQGFPAFYRDCAPRQFRRMAEVAGLEVVESRAYHYSDYFNFFVPLFVGWRVWTLLARAVAGEQAAEHCAIVARRPRASWEPA